MKPRRLSRQTVYRSGWVSLHIDRVRFPAGRIIDRHHILQFARPAVGALVEDALGRLLLVRAYRYPTNSIQWEVPAGRVEAGETVLAAARREIFEESGYQANRLRRLYMYHPLNGISDLRFHIVEARAGRQTGTFDRNEIQSVRWFSARQVRQMIRAGRVQDGLTFTALLLWKRR